MAVRADTQNDGYLKEDRRSYDNETVITTHAANKTLVKRWLTENIQPNDQEIQKGQEYRKFFNGFTLKALMGGLSDFERQALRIAQMDEFTNKNLLEFALVSCLPAAARREQARTDLKREVFSSAQLAGDTGDKVTGEIRVITCNYSQSYARYRVTAQLNESFVDFWFPREIKGSANITAKIKQQRSDNTTQLNYVKVL